MIGCPPGSRWLHIASTREDAQNPDAPICWTDSYANTDYAKLRTYIRDDPHSLISDLIETHYGIKAMRYIRLLRLSVCPKGGQDPQRSA